MIIGQSGTHLSMVVICSGRGLDVWTWLKHIVGVHIFSEAANDSL